MAPMTRAFVQRVEAFAEREGVDLVSFRKGQRTLSVVCLAELAHSASAPAAVRSDQIN